MRLSRGATAQSPDGLLFTPATDLSGSGASGGVRPRSSRYHRDGERRANVLVTKMVANTAPRVGIERGGTARAADFRNTNQHLSGQNETGRNGHQQISSAARSTTLPPLRGR